MGRKRAEMSGQILVYLMSIILIGLIVVFGYRAIGGFVSQTEEIAKIKFFTDLDSVAKRIGYLDVEFRTFQIPKEFKEVCLVSKDRISSFISPEAYSALNPLVRSQWENTRNNVFLLSGVSEFYPFRTEEMRLDTNRNGIEDGNERETSFLCVKTSGSLRLKLEGKGKYIFVSANVSES